MENSIQKLEQLLNSAKDYFQTTNEDFLTYKSSGSSWSKKEILGHLIDSAINNLQRFTEIQFSEKPFQLYRYNQNELVKVNKYNDASTDEILNFWLTINERIKIIMSHQTEETLAYKILVYEEEDQKDLRFLMSDYLDHMEHHLKKILT